MPLSFTMCTRVHTFKLSDIENLPKLRGAEPLTAADEVGGGLRRLGERDTKRKNQTKAWTSHPLSLFPAAL